MESWIERQKKMLDFTLSSLLRRKRKNAALVIVYTLIVFILASVLFFTHSIKKEAAIILKDAPEMVIQRSVAGRHDLIPASIHGQGEKDPGGDFGPGPALGVLL